MAKILFLLFVHSLLLFIMIQKKSHEQILICSDTYTLYYNVLLVILVLVISRANTLLLSTGALGSFTCSGMILHIYMGPTALRGIRATGDTPSNVESQVFTPYNFGSSRDRTPDLLTTRRTCYH